MHSSRMRTIRNSSHLLSGGYPLEQTSPPPEQAPPWEQTPQSRSPQSRHPLEQAPPWRPAARHAGIPPAVNAGIPHPPPVDRQTPVKT